MLGDTIVVPNMVLSSRKRSRGEREPVPKRCLESMDWSVCDGSEVAGDVRMEVTDALLMLEVNRLDIVGRDGHGLGSSIVHGW